ncbi:Pantothenate kinase type III, CoaX-like protein [Candidatus Burkholderia verschuerenii]|uniref:Type III pantothenate kinase n=1 Tax=Candidatus Burkholderia verschuerenii TaxID=242163 RepID=A0A0L0MF35_9BURK|nr:type III pantothenate kinase [Candidatus Burkholderia verschuerenii]KND60916.1 Pantothenate kinase type III, CoaX-like protein [Candidatus Burkholderia verschuerenii]
MSHASFLLIDAGNSRIKWSLVDARGASIANGAFEHERDVALNDPSASIDDTILDDWAALPAPDSAWISNVAGEAALTRIQRLIDTRWSALPCTVVRAQARQCGVVNHYAQPHTLGSDRWCSLIGARAAYPGEHVLIATFGTATTLEALRADGAFTGGLIAPGWSLMMKSLGSHTAQLPTLDADAARRALDSTASRFATDTAAALSAGCLLAQASLVERAWRDLRHDLQADVRLVLGGGAANEIAGALQVPHTRHDSLALSGLALIARDATASHPNS